MKSRGPWFKLFHEWSVDPKVQALSERDQRRMIMIMCFACRGDAPNLDLWAFAMRVRPSELRLTVQRLRAIAFLDDDLQIRNWAERQGKSEAQRKRQQRNTADQDKGDVPGLSRDSPGTRPGLSRVDKIRLDKKEEEEEKEEEEHAAPVEKKRATKKPNHTQEIDECVDLYRRACEKSGIPVRLAAARIALEQRFSRDGGADKCLRAFRLAADRGFLPRYQSESWFKLEWFLRQRTSAQAGSRPVDRIEELIEGDHICEDARPTEVPELAEDLPRDRWLEEVTGEPRDFVARWDEIYDEQGKRIDGTEDHDEKRQREIDEMAARVRQAIAAKKGASSD